MARIEYGYVSGALQRTEVMLRGLGLRQYEILEHHAEPLLVVGVYTSNDRVIIASHRGPLRVELCGGDVRGGEATELLNGLDRPRCQVLAPPVLREDCRAVGLQVDQWVNLFGSDPALYPPCDPGHCVYTYLPFARRDEYGLGLVREVAREFPAIWFYLGRWGRAGQPFANALPLPLWLPPEELVRVYRSCFCGLRTVARDGFSATVAELSLMGRPVASTLDYGLDWVAHCSTAAELVSFVSRAQAAPAIERASLAASARALVTDHTFLDL